MTEDARVPIGRDRVLFDNTPIQNLLIDVGNRNGSASRPKYCAVIRDIARRKLTLFIVDDDAAIGYLEGF